MDKSVKEVVSQRMERTAEALRKNKMDAVCLETAADVVPFIESRLEKGCSVANGGGMSLSQTGVTELLANGNYNYFNRDAKGITPEGRVEEMYKAFGADAYFASANAISESGEIFEVDGLGNRTAAIIYGPKKVYLIVGYNKIVADEAAAWQHIKDIAAPANAKRLSCKTPCAATGKCADCKSDARICCTYVTLRQQRIKDRICVVLVGEELGY